jgi:hypothetical protein
MASTPEILQPGLLDLPDTVLLKVFLCVIEEDLVGYWRLKAASNGLARLARLVSAVVLRLRDSRQPLASNAILGL